MDVVNGGLMKCKWIGFVLLVTSPWVASAQQWASPDASQSDKCALLGLTAYTVVHDRAQGMTPDEVLTDIWTQCKQSPNASSESCGKFAQKLRSQVTRLYNADVKFAKVLPEPDSPSMVEDRAKILRTYVLDHCGEFLQ
jgi:hypothetical protein